MIEDHGHSSLHVTARLKTSLGKRKVQSTTSGDVCDLTATVFMEPDGELKANVWIGKEGHTFAMQLTHEILNDLAEVIARLRKAKEEGRSVKCSATS